MIKSIINDNMNIQKSLFYWYETFYWQCAGSAVQALDGQASDGISRGMTAAEQRVQGLTGAQRSPLAAVLAEDGREIREVLAGADGTRMRIGARVRVARADRVERFDLVTAEPDAELAKSVFFADALDLKGGQAGACCLPPSMRSLPAALDFTQNPGQARELPALRGAFLPERVLGLARCQDDRGRRHARVWRLEGRYMSASERHLLFTILGLIPAFIWITEELEGYRLDDVLWRAVKYALWFLWISHNFIRYLVERRKEKKAEAKTAKEDERQ
ncbi:MAG: hypothetical protein VB067_11315 [Christensenellaceae bacterium]|nr:hypothetical protein [Christensenellaceae bacterium]